MKLMTTRAAAAAPACDDAAGGDAALAAARAQYVWLGCRMLALAEEIDQVRTELREAGARMCYFGGAHFQGQGAIGSAHLVPRLWESFGRHVNRVEALPLHVEPDPLALDYRAPRFNVRLCSHRWKTEPVHRLNP